MKSQFPASSAPQEGHNDFDDYDDDDDDDECCIHYETLVAC
jgi:hypothetical protein